MKLAGSRFKESVSSFVDNFTGQAQDHTMSLMDRAAHHVMLHHDLSQFEPGHFQTQTREGFTEGFMDAVKNAQDNDFTRAVENIGKNRRHEPVTGGRQRFGAVSFYALE